MEDPIINDFLNGMPFREFIVLYVWALFGALLSFAWTVIRAVKNDTRTSHKFEWQYFWKGAIRTIATVITMAVAIVFWPEISGILFQSETPIELTSWAAFFVIGVGSDKITEAIWGAQEEGWKYMKKKANGG